MKGQETLQAEFEVVTPLFCAGADQKGLSEVRPFSIRGALRWWYRAIDAEFLTKEADIFGATIRARHSSPITLSLARWIQGSSCLKERLLPEKSNVSGAAYLGYTLYLGQNERKALEPLNQPINIQLKWNWKPATQNEQQYIRRAWAAALWFFGHLGGLGSRARRGYGTLALTRWSGWPECELLGTAHGAATPEEWKARFDRGFVAVRQWFSVPRQARHPHIGAASTGTDHFKIYLWKQGQSTWLEALEKVGWELQNFRKESQWHKPELLAAFGLPIAFRSQKKTTLLVQPKGRARAASTMQIRVVRIGKRFHPLVWLALGKLVPEDELQLEYFEVEHGKKKPSAYNSQPPAEWDSAPKAFLEKIRGHCVP